MQLFIDRELDQEALKKAQELLASGEDSATIVLEKGRKNKGEYLIFRNYQPTNGQMPLGQFEVGGITFTLVIDNKIPSSP